MKQYRDIKLSHIKALDQRDPIRWPKVQCGYEGLANTIFKTELDNMFMDLTKEMVQLKK